MSADETPNGERGDESIDGDGHPGEGGENTGVGGTGNVDSPEDGDVGPAEVRERLEKSADRAIDQFDERLIDLLAWMLETETRARIYVALRSESEQTSDEIAERTGLYPSTVREALASLHEDGVVTREKRQSAGAGNNPFEYSAISPSDLVGELVEDIQEQLNAVFNLDRYIARSESDTDGDDPVTITVTDRPGDGDDEGNEDSPQASSEEEQTDGDETDDGDGK